MYAMPALHKANSCRRREHVFAANRTITVDNPLNALMVLFLGDGDTCTAFLLYR